MDTKTETPRYTIIYRWFNDEFRQEHSYALDGISLPWSGDFSVRSEWGWLIGVGAVPLRVERVDA